MHVMSKYLDTYKATLAALEDYASMQHILETTDQAIKDETDKLYWMSSSNLDGMPKAKNPKAGEERIAASMDRVDAYRERYRQARDPPGACSARMTGSCWTRSSSPPTTLARRTGHGQWPITSTLSARQRFASVPRPCTAWLPPCTGRR